MRTHYCRSQGIFFAGCIAAVKALVSPHNRLSVPISDDKWLMAPRTRERAAIHVKRCHHNPPAFIKSQKTAAMLEQQSTGVRSISFDRAAPRRKVANSCHVIVSSCLEKSPEPGDSHAELRETIRKKPVSVRPCFHGWRVVHIVFNVHFSLLLVSKSYPQLRLSRTSFY